MKVFRLYYILKLARPRQWIKNFALFAGITFGGQLFNLELLKDVTLGFIGFCFLSSATYIINDIFDLRKDRLHPFKKARPIASGKISIKEGAILAFILIIAFLAVTRGLPSLFYSVSIIFLILQILYSAIFKSLVIFDILFIAAGYILRVFAGEFISEYHISVWLLLTTISLSLFLAVGKRRSELTLLQSVTHARIEEIRKSLSHYSEKLLDVFTAVFATSTFVFYSMFTFLESQSGLKINLDILLPDFLPPYLQRKWLMVTIVPVVFGIMRYTQDIYERGEGESPERVLLSDKYLLGAVAIWALLVIFIIYFLS